MVVEHGSRDGNVSKPVHHFNDWAFFLWKITEEMGEHE